MKKHPVCYVAEPDREAMIRELYAAGFRRGAVSLDDAVQNAKAWPSPYTHVALQGDKIMAYLSHIKGNPNYILTNSLNQMIRYAAAHA